MRKILVYVCYGSNNYVRRLRLVEGGIVGLKIKWEIYVR